MNVLERTRTHTTPRCGASLVAHAGRCAVLIGLLFAIGGAADAAQFSNLAPDGDPPVLNESEPFVATIPIRNPYDRAIKVHRIDSSCVCTELELASHFLLPHETTTLAVAVENETYSGARRQVVRIELTDPQLEVLTVELQWTVIANVTVDSMPLSGPFDRRPDPLRRDVSIYTAHERPDEAHRLRKVLRVASPAATAPDDGLSITAIDYTGGIWSFTTQRQDANAWLVVAAAKHPDRPPPVGTYEESVVIHTNHPAEPRIDLQFMTAIDPEAGSKESGDPWADLR